MHRVPGAVGSQAGIRYHPGTPAGVRLKPTGK